MMRSLDAFAIGPSQRGDPRPRPGVLVVDDDPAVCELLAEGLPRYGFAVWVAESGGAVDLYRRHQGAIDLVLLDSRLLDYNGLDLLAALRRFDPAVRCCFTAGFLDHQDAARLFDQGVVGILTKPFRLEGLAAALRLLVALPAGGSARRGCRLSHF
jgi:two-component system response regulator YesN